MTDEKNVIHINVAGEDEPGLYYLILRKGGGMFGGGGSVTFSVDGIMAIETSKGDPVYFTAYRNVHGGKEIVVTFPITSVFELILKKQTLRLSEVEAAQRQKELNKKLDEIMGTEGEEDPHPVMTDSTQGYL